MDTRKREFCVTNQSSQASYQLNPAPRSLIEFEREIRKQSGLSDFRIQQNGVNLDPISYERLTGKQRFDMVEDPYNMTPDQIAFWDHLEDVVREAKIVSSKTEKAF